MDVGAEYSGVKSAAERQAQPRRGMELLARAGLVARGVLYVLIGVLAVDVAQGETAKNASQQGAIHTVASQPFGKTLLVILAVGVFGYAAWRAVETFRGKEIETGEKRDTGERVGSAAAAIAYAVLFATIVGSLIGGGSGNGGGGLNRLTTWAMDKSPWIVGAAGVILIGVALYQGYKGVSRSFMKKIKRGGETARRWIARLGSVGYCARMVVFGLIGFGLIQAARSYDPGKAKGLDASLQSVLQQQYGNVWVAVVAFGLIAFGVFSIAESRYRRV
jgi:uncharacterized protein DUF1206